MRSRRRCRAARVWLLVALAMLTSACYAARAGFRPPVERLPELRPGISSKADVEALLGTPLGSGAARFTVEMTRRQIWVYGYLDYGGKSMGMEHGQLLVFFDGDHYDGHVWIAGKPPEPGWGGSPP